MATQVIAPAAPNRQVEVMASALTVRKAPRRGGINFIQLISTIIDQIAQSHFPASGSYHEANRGSAGNRVNLACWVR